MGGQLLFPARICRAVVAGAGRCFFFRTTPLPLDASIARPTASIDAEPPSSELMQSFLRPRADWRTHHGRQELQGARQILSNGSFFLSSLSLRSLAYQVLFSVSRIRT